MKTKKPKKQKLAQSNGPLIRLYLRMAFYILVYTIIFFYIKDVSFSAVYDAFWTGTEPFFIAIYFIGLLLIFATILQRPFRYIAELLSATKKVYDPDIQTVELPREIKEYEGEFAQLKMEYLRNRQTVQETEQRKNDLVAYLAHDLKTPMTSIIGYLTLLKDESEISPELQNRYLNITLDKAEHLDDLIDEFFEITRFNVASISLNYEEANLSRLLEQLEYEFKPMLAEKGLTCQLNLTKDVVLSCDIDKIQRVFDNLLRNAVNYSFPNSEIVISLQVIDNTVMVSFQNHGQTISTEKLSKIFEQFYRLDSARTSKSGGAGLGLAISKEIVEAHNGTIFAYSKDQIIEFKVTLPLL